MCSAALRTQQHLLTLHGRVTVHERDSEPRFHHNVSSLLFTSCCRGPQPCSPPALHQTAHLPKGLTLTFPAKQSCRIGSTLTCRTFLGSSLALEERRYLLQQKQAWRTAWRGRQTAQVHRSQLLLQALMHGSDPSQKR